MALPRNVVPFDSGEPAGPTAPMPSEAELRALIEELKNTNPGALAKGPPKRKERIPGLQAVLTKASSAAGAAPSRSSGAPPARAGGERLPGLQAMVSKVSATPQGTRIPGLGFVKDPTDDGPDGEPDSDSDDRAPAGPPARSADPFSQAAKQMYPLGMKNRHIGALGAMAASVVPGVGPFVAGALGGLGSYGLTTEDQDLDATSAGLSAATGGMGGMLLGKVLPPVAKAIGSRLPNFTNDAKVAAEFGNDLARGVAGPGEALSSRGVTPGPAAPPPQLGQGQPLALPQGPRARIVSSEPLSSSSPALGWESSPRLPAPPPQLGPGAQQLGPGFASEGFLPEAATAPLRPRPPVSPGFLPNEATLAGPAPRAPLQAPPIPEIPGEPLPFRARVGAPAGTSPMRLPPPPLSGTPPMKVRVAPPRGQAAVAPPGRMDTGVADAAISEIRNQFGLGDTAIRVPQQSLNGSAALAPSMPPPAGLPGATQAGADGGLGGLLRAADAGDRRALAVLAGLGLPVAGGAGVAAGLGLGSLLSPQAAPGDGPSPFALQRPFASQRQDRLQPTGVKALQGKGGPPPRKKKPKK